MKTSRLRARRATPGDRRLLGPQHRRREPLASLCRVGREVPPFVEVSSGGRPQHGGLRTGVLVGFDRLVQIRDETDTAILMVEQNARKALSVSDRGTSWIWARTASRVPATTCWRATTLRSCTSGGEPDPSAAALIPRRRDALSCFVCGVTRTPTRLPRRGPVQWCTRRGVTSHTMGPAHAVRYRRTATRLPR